MQTAYHPAFGLRVPFRFDWLPESADGQVRGAISKVISYMREDAKASLISEDCRRVLELGGGDPIRGIWKHVKPLMKFQRDEKTAADLETDDPRIQDTVEVFIRPVDQSLLIKLRGMGLEDCDGYVMYAGCILLALHIPVSLVTIAADAKDPSRFSHVYLAVYPDGFGRRRIPLDLSHGPYPGWECTSMLPPGRRIKEWPVQYTAGEHFMKFAVTITLLGGAYYGLRRLAA